MLGTQFRRTYRAIQRATVGRSTQQDVSAPLTAEDVHRAYEYLLGRPPESESIVRQQVRRYKTIMALCQSIMQSPEFQGRFESRPIESPAPAGRGLLKVSSDAPDDQVITAFEAYTGPGYPGFVTDFLGTRTRTEYITGLQARDSTVEHYPIPGNFHGCVTEWAGTLRAVLDARDRIVAVELGAGWGPWLTAVAAAAKQRGLIIERLVGVEAAESHCQWMWQHFRDNGLDPAEHTLLHGAVTPMDGAVEFPELNDPAADYGATLATDNTLLHRVVGPGARRIPGYSLPTLLDPFDRVDLVHIDIQGSEADVIHSSRDVLLKKVGRLVIGTHGRAIEQQLMEDLSASRWILEADVPCRYGPFQGGIALAVDGCQVWKNSEFF